MNRALLFSTALAALLVASTPAHADPASLGLAGTAIISFLSTTIVGSVTVGSVLTTIALSGASYLLSSLNAPKGPKSMDEGQKVVSQQAVPIQRMILGKALVGGPLFFLECKPPYLYYGVILASHEIDGLEEFRIGDKIVTLDPAGHAISSNYNDGTNSYVQVSIRTGTASQAIDPILAADFPELPSTFRQQGHATAVVKFWYGSNADNHEKFWGNQTPEPKFLVRGAKVLDPNDPTQSSADPSTWKWSDTAALCQAFWLTHAKGGKRPWSKIDIEGLKAAAKADATLVPCKGGAMEKRYTVNGVVTLDQEPIDVVQSLLTANLGRLVWRNGKYTILSGVPRTAVWTLNDDSARGALEARYDRPRRELINTMRTRFTAPDREYQVSDGPVLVNSAYLADDGEEHDATIELPFTASHPRAQRIANITLERSRRGRLINRSESIEAIRLSAADVVNFESAFLTMLSGPYELNKAMLSHEALEVEVELEQYDPAIYDWDPETQEQDFSIEPAELAGVN